MATDDDCPTPETMMPEIPPVLVPQLMPESPPEQNRSLFGGMPRRTPLDDDHGRDHDGPPPPSSGPGGNYGGSGYQGDDGILPNTTRLGDLSPELQETFRAHRQGEADATVQMYGEDHPLSRVNRSNLTPDSRFADWYYEDVEERYNGMSPDEVYNRAFDDKMAEHERFEERIRQAEAEAAAPAPDEPTPEAPASGAPAPEILAPEALSAESPDAEKIAPEREPEEVNCFESMMLSSLPPLGTQVTLASEDASNNLPHKAGQNAATYLS